MAYDSLKALIRQYIKTNGEQEITGQILQNVLVEMVNQYPSTDGYATQSWVISQLAGYLPLTGGNLDGNLSIYDTMNIYSSSIEWNDNGDYCRITFDDDGITVTAHGTGYVIANEFIKSGGTSAQFLKADGSVDSNAYITASALTGYATQSWVKGNLSVWNNVAMTWGTLTAANGYNIGIHASTSDGGDWGMCYKSGQISMQLDGWYYQNEGRYRVVDTSDLASYNPTTNFKTINNQSIIGTGNINIEGGGGGSGNYVPAYSPTGYNINTCYDSGLYLVQNGSNTPFGDKYAELLTLSYRKLTGNTIPNFAAQIILPNGDNPTLPNAMFYRTSQKNSWNAWQQVFTTSGGTITGNLTVNGLAKFNNDLTFANDRGIKFGTDNYVHINRDNSRLLIINEAGDDIIIGDYDDRNYTSFANDLQGVICNTDYYISNTTWSILQDGTARFKSVSQTSDLRKKTIMGDVPMNIYNVANAPLFKFTWKDEKKYSGQHIGSAAQYWQTVLPELVSIGRDADMTLAMQYDVIALASAITVAKTVVNHEERIILLERENEALRQEIADLKSA